MPELTWAQMQEEAKTQGFEPHPVGTYNFEVTQSEVVPGKKSNQISIRLVNLDGPYAGRSVLNRLAPFKNTGEVNGMFFAQLAALGFGSDNPVWGQIQNVGLDQGLQYLAPQLMGKRVVCDITHRNDYDGQNRDNVRKMRPYGGPGAGIPGIPGIPTPQVPGVAPNVPVPQAVPIPQPVAPAPVAQPVAPVAAQVPVPQEYGVEQGQQPASLPPSPVAPVPPQVVPMAPVAQVPDPAPVDVAGGVPPTPVIPGAQVAVEDDGSPVVAQVTSLPVPPLPGQPQAAGVPQPPVPSDQAPPF